jgi:hypothetical protein
VRESGGGWTQRFWLAAARSVGMPPDRGALALLRAATDPGARGGDLWGPRWGAVGPPVRRPAVGRPGDAGARLWRLSESAAHEPFDVAALVRAQR